MAAESSKINIGSERVQIYGPTIPAILDPFVPPGIGYWVYISNNTTIPNHTAYVGDDGIVAGEGIAIPSGPLAGRLPVAIFVRLPTSLYAITKVGEECELGILKMT